jgi:hypothetical protein
MLQHIDVPATNYPWRREIHIIDPGGVCGHVPLRLMVRLAHHREHCALQRTAFCLPNRKIGQRVTLGDPFFALTGTNVSTNLKKQRDRGRVLSNPSQPLIKIRNGD